MRKAKIEFTENELAIVYRLIDQHCQWSESQGISQGSPFEIREKVTEAKVELSWDDPGLGWIGTEVIMKVVRANTGKVLGFTFQGEFIDREDFDSWTIFKNEAFDIAITRLKADSESPHAIRMIHADAQKQRELDVPS